MEIYISTDIEADGPIPGVNSMLSLASVAFDSNGNEISSFEINLETIGVEDPDTMDFWSKNIDAYKETRKDIVPPEIAMEKYNDWLKSLNGTPVFTAYPLAFDYMFVAWYLMKYTGKNPFGHNGIDIRSYAMGMLNTTYKKAGKKDYPIEWFGDTLLTHKAIDDARHQGVMFSNMMKENNNLNFKA